MSAVTRRDVLTGASALALAPVLSSAGSAASALLTPHAMRRDIAVLDDAYTTLHPGLYRYLTPMAFRRERQRLDRFAGAARSPGDFYLALSAFTASIRCGHSFPNPANQPAQIAALFGKPDRLPLAFTWVDRRMIVTRDLGSGSALAPGSTVLAVDGIASSALLQRMLPYQRTDGTNDARKIADLGIPGDADLPSFDVLRSLLFPSAGRFTRLEVERHGRRSSIVCPLMTAADRDAALRRPDAASPYGWRFEICGRVGVLTMPTWAVFHEPWDWRAFIDTSLDTAIDRTLAGIVVDLRENAGGLDCGAALLARLITTPLTANDYSRHVRYRTVPDRLAPFLETWDRRFRDWGTAAAGPDAAGFYALAGDGDAGDAALIAPAKRRFMGKVVILIGPKNASATFGFAATVKQHRLATLVGEPTGGNLRGINGGAFFFVGLPESRIEVDLPLIAYWPDTPQPDAGVRPDIAVPLTPADLAASRDRQMARALGEAAS